MFTLYLLGILAGIVADGGGSLLVQPALRR
jgi:hypothetical protein